MKIKSHIPNTITVLNLLCGSIAIIILLKGYVMEAALLIGLAAILDFFDGFAARALNAYSAIGKDLDSLADMISFGLAPAMFLYYLMSLNPIFSQGNTFMQLLPYTAMFIAAFSGLRLAKFNNDTRQTVSFIGLPTPANAMLIVPLVVVALSESSNPIISQIAGNYILHLALIPVTNYLLISEIPMFSLKFTRDVKLPLNQLRIALILIGLTVFIFLGWAGISVSIIIYVLMSLIFRKK